MRGALPTFAWPDAAVGEWDEADVLKGRTITSWPSLQTDISNAGGNWVDEQVVVDEARRSLR